MFPGHLYTLATLPRALQIAFSMLSVSDMQFIMNQTRYFFYTSILVLLDAALGVVVLVSVYTCELCVSGEDSIVGSFVGENIT